MTEIKYRPGEVRDAIIDALTGVTTPLSPKEIQATVALTKPGLRASSIRSYLRLNTDTLFDRPERARYILKEQAKFIYGNGEQPAARRTFVHGQATLVEADCIDWLNQREPHSIHAVVTDPPYGLVEYSPRQQFKLRSGKGGVWRIPPSFDGAVRAPLPRFTVLKEAELTQLSNFFVSWGKALVPVLVPGATVVVASNPLLSYLVSSALAKSGLERRGEIVRLVMTMRGGDRPKAAHEEFADVSVMPRSMWEPWLVFRKPIEGRVQDNLRTWRTGGFRRISATKPFGDVIQSSPTRKGEKLLAPHPSLKPQAFLRALVRGVLPLGEGIVLDPFAGSGSTLAAAEFNGYESIGVECDPAYFDLACEALPKLIQYEKKS